MTVGSSAEAPKVFVSYRRKDTVGHTGRLVDDLNSRLRDPVFKDLDAIPPGAEFAKDIRKALGSCKVLVAVIGCDWLTVTDAAGRRRIDDPGDLVRVEIATALERKIPVIPVLVPDATMPGERALPPDLAELSQRNAIKLSDAHWPDDVEDLLDTIKDIVPWLVVSLRPPRPLWSFFRKLGIALAGGFPAPLLVATLLPQQMRGLLVALSAIAVGLSAVVFELYRGEHFSHSAVTRRFTYALIAVAGLVSFVGLRMVLTETVRFGSREVNVLTGFGDRASPPRCPCPENWDDRECLVRLLDETNFKMCWGSLKTERVLLWAACLTLSAGFGGFIGLVGLQREATGRRR